MRSVATDKRHATKQRISRVLKSRTAFARVVARRTCIHCATSAQREFVSSENCWVHLKNGRIVECAASTVWRTLAEFDARSEFWGDA